MINRIESKSWLTFGDYEMYRFLFVTKYNKIYIYYLLNKLNEHNPLKPTLMTESSKLS